MSRRTVMREAAQDPCRGCPWRTANHGKAHPDGWYSKANLRRLWAGLRTGDAPGMTCHPTDPDNPVSAQADAEGYRPAPDGSETRECAGAIILQQRELMRYQEVVEAGGSFADYKRGNPGAMTKGALAAFLTRCVMTWPGEIPVRRDHDLRTPVSRP